MKAVICRSYGSPDDVLRIEDVDKPACGNDELLIRVRAAGLNPANTHMLTGKSVVRMMYGMRRPKDPRTGADVAGVVESVGRNVTRFKAGDEVFGMCRGALAEYACISIAVMKPANVPFEQAGAVAIAGFTALQALRDKAQLRAGQTVLINGAAGGVGSFAVQIAKAFGAHVTGVCSARNVELVRSIGADEVLDYSREDFTKRGERYDVILDCYSNRSLFAYRRVMKPDGQYIAIGGPFYSALALVLRLITTLLMPRFRIMVAKRSIDDLAVLAELMAAGKLTPVIEQRYALTDVAKAYAHVAAGHTRGKVVIIP
jgi:NADPH:quinone reductase-like Zn-dependent oxidoreductase